MKKALQNIKFFLKRLRKYWTNRFLVIIRKEKDLSIVFSLKLTPRRIFVLGTITFLLIIMLTAVLIAFTPMRVYVPGYTNPTEYILYRKMLTRVDSVERINAMQKVYLDNFFNVINDIVVSEEMNASMEGVTEKRVKDKAKTEQAKKELNEAAEQLLIEITDRETKTFIPLSQQITSPTFTFTMPALGFITTLFSIQDRHFGIDIENEKGTLITAIADGVVIYTEHTEKGENIIIIQHGGNMVSLYKNIDKLFKNEGTRVKSGTPIATMGNHGIESPKPYLHFELWYNGAPINPLQYFLGN